MKTCTKCGVIKAEAEFYQKQESRGGRDTFCKTCKLEYAAIYRANNRRLLSQKQSAYAEAHKHILAPKQATWRATNKEVISEKKKRDYLKDPKKIIERSAAWAAANPEVIKVHFHNTRAKKKGVQGQLSRDLISKLLVEQNNCCAACKQPLSKPYHVDHIVALSKGGLNIDSNIQLLHPLCNAYKGVLSNEEFLQRLNKGKL